MITVVNLVVTMTLQAGFVSTLLNHLSCWLINLFFRTGTLHTQPWEKVIDLV